MKTISRFFFTLIAVVAIGLTATQAQVCVPDMQYTNGGLYPSATDSAFSPAFEGIPYSTVVTAVVPADTLVPPFLFNFDSVHVITIDGLPPNFTYDCEPTNCTFVGNTSGCVLISGTGASGSAGVYPLTVYTTTYLSHFLTGQVVQQDTIIGYQITILPGIPAVCVPDTQYTIAGLYPPATDSAFAVAWEGQPYSEVVTAVVPIDTLIPPFLFNFDSVHVIGITGLPSGIGYSCEPPNCTFPGNSLGCVLISGTPAPGSAGVYPLIVYTVTYLSHSLTGQIPQYDTIVGYQITVLSPGYCTPAASPTQGWMRTLCIGPSCHNTGNDGGYGDYTGIYGRLPRGNNYAISLRPGGGGGNPGPFIWRVWIDLNQDMDFDDNGELRFGTTSPSNSVVTGNFSIPNSAMNGATRMRVACGNTITGPCDSIPFGEVQDYTILIAKPYCNYGANSSTSSWIQGFCVNTTCINNGNNGGYRSTNTSSFLGAGNNYSVTLTPGYSGTPVPVWWKIFLDLNLDGDYDDANEMVFETTSASTSPINSTFSVTSAAYNGDTKIRFMMSEAPFTNACDNIANGEVEVYGIKLQGGQGGKLGDQVLEFAPVAVQELDVTLYPNPATASVNVQFNNTETLSNVSWRLMDMSGKQIMEQRNQTIMAGESRALSVKNLPAGIYWLNYQAANASGVKKLVIVK